MILLNIIQRDTTLKRTASTNGGEYHGPCPACGGNDRFALWPQKGPTGRYWCRKCGISGDGIDYLRKQKGLTFKQACDELGYTPQSNNTWEVLNRHVDTSWTRPPQNRKPKEACNYEVKVLNVPTGVPVDKTICQASTDKGDPVFDIMEDQTIQVESRGDDVGILTPQCYSPWTALHEHIQKLGCRNCNHLRDQACSGGDYPRLVAMLESCPKIKDQGTLANKPHINNHFA